MPQFVAGGVLTPGAPSRIGSRPSADSGRPRRGPFNTTKIRSHTVRAFVVQVIPGCAEEPVRGWHHPVMPALTFKSQQAPVPRGAQRRDQPVHSGARIQRHHPRLTRAAPCAELNSPRDAGLIRTGVSPREIKSV
jgi:hypothetical protein